MSTIGERNTSKWVRDSVVGLALALALTTVSAAREQAATQTFPGAMQPNAAKAEKRPKGGMGEGIKVHGHWTIEIKNSDGTLASHHEFENGLADSQAVLAKLLGRQASIGRWWVQILTNQSICGNAASECDVTEGFETATPPAFQNLVATVDPGVPGGRIVLKGTAHTVLAGQLTGVRTIALYCPPSQPGCVVGGTSTFTAHDLSPAMSIQGDQTIDVTVVISFS